MLSACTRCVWAILHIYRKMITINTFSLHSMCTTLHYYRKMVTLKAFSLHEVWAILHLYRKSHTQSFQLTQGVGNPAPLQENSHTQCFQLTQGVGNHCTFTGKVTLNAFSSHKVWAILHLYRKTVTLNAFSSHKVWAILHLYRKSHTQCFQLTQGVGNTASLQEKSHSMLSAHTRCGQYCIFTGKVTLNAFSSHKVWAILHLYRKSHTQSFQLTQGVGNTASLQEKSHSKLSAHTRCGQYCIFTGKVTLNAFSSHKVWAILHLYRKSHTQCFQLTQGVGNTASLQEKSHSMLSAHTRCGQYCIFTGKVTLNAFSSHKVWAILHLYRKSHTQCFQLTQGVGNTASLQEKSHSKLSAHTRCGQYCIFTGKVTLKAFSSHKVWAILHLYRKSHTQSFQLTQGVGNTASLQEKSHSMLSAHTRCGQYCIFTGKVTLKAFSSHKVWAILHLYRKSHTQSFQLTQGVGNTASLQEKSHSMLSAHTRCGQYCIFTGKVTLNAFSSHKVWAILHLYRKSHTQSFQLTQGVGNTASLQEKSHSKLSAHTRCGQYCIFTGKVTLKAFSSHKVWAILHLYRKSHTHSFQLTQGVGNTASLQEKSHSMLSAHTRCGQYCIFTGKVTLNAFSSHKVWAIPHL